jgi:hypothetical protein
MYVRECNLITNLFRGDGQMKKVALLLCMLSCVGLVNAAFTWNETGVMVYDGAGVDSGMNPYTVSEGGSGDIQIQGSLTVQSGSLTIAGGTPWGDKLGQQASGASLTVNGGSLNWVLENDNEDRLMLGNGPLTTSCAVTMNGGSFFVTGPGGYNASEQNFRMGSDGASITMNLNAGVIDCQVNIPVAFGGKWTNFGGTWTEPAAGVSIMNINNGSFVVSGGSIFGVGNNDVINFLTGGTGKLSINGWDASKFGTLLGKLQIDGVAQTDLSKFAVGVDGAQGTLSLVPEPATLALLGLGVMSLIRRKK